LKSRFRQVTEPNCIMRTSVQFSWVALHEL